MFSKRKYSKFKNKQQIQLNPSSPHQNENILHLFNKVASKHSNPMLPKLVFLHQLYSLKSNKTWIDQEIGRLRNNGDIIMFKLAVGEDNYSLALAMTEEISQHILKLSSSRTVVNFVKNILPHLSDISVDKTTLFKRFNISEIGMRELVRENILLIRNVGQYWLSFPNSGQFISAYNAGRKALLMSVRNAKYGEILENDLIARKLPKKATLGMHYYICDLIGSNAVICVQTTSGRMFRLAK